MAEVTYTCPKCGATLRPARPVPAGKKIKCPKCENIFAPAAQPAPATTAPKPAAASKPRDDDEDTGGTYKVIDEPPPPEPEMEPQGNDDDEDQPRKKKREKSAVADEILKRSAPRTKKGAAQAICQKPSNQLLATSSLACTSSLLTIMVLIWPIVFKSPRDWDINFLAVPDVPRLILLVFTIIAFAYNGVIAIGAVKLQAIESYAFAMLACFLSIIPVSGFLAVFAFAWFLKLLDAILDEGNAFVPFTILIFFAWYTYVGVWNLITLRKADVVEGFAEKKPEYGD